MTDINQTSTSFSVSSPSNRLLFLNSEPTPVRWKVLTKTMRGLKTPNSVVFTMSNRCPCHGVSLVTTVSGIGAVLIIPTDRDLSMVGVVKFSASDFWEYLKTESWMDVSSRKICHIFLLLSWKNIRQGNHGKPTLVILVNLMANLYWYRIPWFPW